MEDILINAIEDGREIIVIRPNNGDIRDLLDTLYSLDYNIEISVVNDDIISLSDLIWHESIIILPDGWWSNYNAHAILDKMRYSTEIIEWRC